ncbi:MAG: ADP-ribosylglycohydrolase family protein [Endomicrobia bacterium]|nr:ADP-ribosylglycohydrolase family protein [Endomicrobiia bacterium]
MLGAIVGDIVGSRFEFDDEKVKAFDLFSADCFFTDDSVMSIAIAKAIIESKGDYSHLSDTTIKYMQSIGRNYPNCGYGDYFYRWIFHYDNPKPYNSYGNGAAMRVSACGWAAKTLEEVKLLSKKVTEISHNHEEGLKGAEATAISIFMARQGKTVFEIRKYIDDNYYDLDFTLDEIREDYKFDETCQGTVPQAITAFLESTSFEDAIRKAISIGGDSDTIGAITGSIAEAYYGITNDIREKALTYLDKPLKQILLDFEKIYTPKILL